MRLSLLAAAAVTTIAASAVMAPTQAQAFGLPGKPIAVNDMTQDVRLVCTRRWNGYRWIRTCRETRPRRRYVRPRYYVPVPPPPRYYYPY